MDTYLGTVQAFAFNFTPRGWLPCDGRLMNINDYTALFSLLGTSYGGDGIKTFRLPNLRGRIAIGTKDGGLHSIEEVKDVATKGGDIKGVEVNYCICVEGIFPSRS